MNQFYNAGCALHLYKPELVEMPCDEVCVYCISCIKSMHIGGRKPRYLLDLLFNQPTEPGVYDTVEWHNQLEEYIDQHKM